MKLRGFTLIELLVVVAIVAILAAILFPVFGATREKARSIACLSNCKQMGLAVHAYTMDWDEALPTVRMIWPGVVPAESWLKGIQPYTSTPLLRRCPSDQSENWEDPTPRVASYGLNAYLDALHPPYGDVECPSAFLLADIANPARTIFIVELSEMKGRTDSPMTGDHVMPQYWGNPPRVVDAEMQARQWDPEAGKPKTLAYDRHNGGSNYVFADGHAKWLRFEQTFRQEAGLAAEVDMYDPGRR